MTCADCGGSGQVQRVRQSLLGQMVTTGPCPRCSGLGQVVVTPCPTCRGEGRVTSDHTYQVDVPAGVDSGSTLRLSGRGAAGPRGGGAGDLYVHLRVAEHERYWRDGNDLVTEVPISIAQAALGTTVALPTLDGDEELSSRPARSRVVSSCCAAVACPGCRAAAAATCGRSSSSRCRRSSATRRPSCSASCAEQRGEPVEPAGQGPVLAHQVGVLVGGRDGRALRRSAAHVLVADVAAPVLDDADAPPPRAACCASATARPSPSPTAPAAGGRAARRGGRRTRRRRRSREPPPGPPLTVAVAPPKGDRLEWLVQKCTEVGVDRIVLLDAERSVVRWDGDRAASSSTVCAASPPRRRCSRGGCGCPSSTGRVPASRCCRRSPSPSREGGRRRRRHVRSPSGPRAAGRRAELARRPTGCRSAPHVLRVETAAVVAAALMVAAMSERSDAVRRVRPRPVLLDALRLLRVRHLDRSAAPHRRVPRRAAAEIDREVDAGMAAATTVFVGGARRPSCRPVLAAVLRAIPLAPAPRSPSSAHRR